MPAPSSGEIEVWHIRANRSFQVTNRIERNKWESDYFSSAILYSFIGPTRRRGPLVNLTSSFAELRSSNFVRAVGVLTSGIVLAHGITAIATPITTRLYAPADFNLLAPFASIVSIVGTAACLRFDTAVPIPPDHRDGANLLAMALLSSMVVSLISGAVATVAPHIMPQASIPPALRAYPWLMPVGVALFGSYSALQGWFLRQKDFAVIAKTRVGQSFAGASLQLGMGVFGISPLGLMLGQIVTWSGGGLVMAGRVLAGPRSIIRLVSAAQMRQLLRTFSRFPTYSTVESLFNTGGMQIPVIMIAGLTAGPEAGYLMLAMFVMQAPMGLIGTSVNQVYVSRAPAEHRSGRLASFTIDVYAGLLKTGVGPLLFAGIVSPVIFAVLFGHEWRRAGVLVAWMTPWFVMQFLVVPISLALHVTNHLRTALALQAVGMFIRITAVLVARHLNAMISEAYALSGLVFYLIYLVTVFRTVGVRLTDVSRATVRATPLIACWVVVGLAVLGVASVLHRFTAL